jgi:hypothetical protein
MERSRSVLPSHFQEVQPYRHLRQLLDLQIDMQFEDLRTLLQLPRREDGLRGGCNLTATALACNIVAGASVLFFEASPEALAHRGDRSRRFRAVMTGYYPWSASDGKRDDDGAEVLYDFTRNPLSHSLGVQKNPRAFPGAAGGKAVMLAKSRDGLPGEVVTELLNARDRPEWLSPTITVAPEADVVSVETLAWGVHEMLRRLFADEAQATAANATARSLLGN